jgi:signal peptidase II
MPQVEAKPELTYSWAWCFIPLAGFIFSADQLSKWYIFSLTPAEIAPWQPLIQHHYNTGVAWGIGHQMPLLVVGITLLLIPLLFYVWWSQFRVQGRWENVAFGAIMGGALGNAVDRVVTQFGALDGVRDFISVDLNIIGIDYVWPTFNIADAGICCGVICLLVLSLFKRPQPKNMATRAVV